MIKPDGRCGGQEVRGREEDQAGELLEGELQQLSSRCLERRTEEGTACDAPPLVPSPVIRRRPGGGKAETENYISFRSELCERSLRLLFPSRPCPERPGRRLRGDAARRRPRPTLDGANIEVIYNHVILGAEGRVVAVPEGGIVALLGANGAGKTTTLKAISNLLRAERGEVTKGTIL